KPALCPTIPSLAGSSPRTRCALSATSCCSPASRQPPCLDSRSAARCCSTSLESTCEANLRQKFGQHFLVSPAVLDRIASLVCGSSKPSILEIGPGRGALTEKLLGCASHV